MTWIDQGTGKGDAMVKTLFLSGHGISMRVENARPLVKDGREFERSA